MFLRTVTTSGSWVLATCAQPMLWGTADAHGQYNGAGRQGPLQFSDDVHFDGSHTSSECYSYAYSSICPSILGGMLQFWGSSASDSCNFADCDNDGTVNTRDFLCFLGRWSAGDLSADCDGDGSISTADSLCYLGIWAGCC